MVPPRPIEPAELLAHAGWMRALAGSLVHGSLSADDVVQESMVAALRRPPLSGRPLEAWLAGVVRNVASRLRRTEQRLSDRHARIESNEPAPGPLETIERLDTQQMIVQLVRELDEPERAVIVLRFFEGLSSEEIGRRMGVSDATVRWRLQKALEQLRARLQRDFGSRQAWCAVLAPLAVSSKLTASVATGVIVMGTASKVAIAAVVVTAIGAVLWFAGHRGEPAIQTAEAAAPAIAHLIEAPRPATPTSPAREAVIPTTDSSAAKPTAVSPTPLAATETSGTRVRARFVSANGQPWDRVTFQSTGWRETSTTGGPDGRAELALDAAGGGADNFQLVASREGCASQRMPATVPAGKLVDLGDVVLQRECRIQGRVHDADHAGLANVRVGISPVEMGEEDPDVLRRRGCREFEEALIVGVTDARGFFDLGAVSKGRWRVWGKGEGRGYGISEPFEVEVGDVKSDVDFEVPALLPIEMIRGKVLDPEGNPAPKALVSFSFKSGNSEGSTGAWTDANGAFELVVRIISPGDMFATDFLQQPRSSEKLRVEPGARDIVLKLLDPNKSRKARVRVVGPKDELVRGIRLQFMAGVTGGRLESNEIEPGLNEFVLPDGPFRLMVSAPGYLDSEWTKLDPASIAPELEFKLDLAPVLRGRVTAGGSPVVGAQVVAQRAGKKGTSLTVNGLPSLMEGTWDEGVKCAADGTFTLTLSWKGPAYVRAAAPDFAASFAGPFAGEDPSKTEPPTAGEILIDLNVGGAIEGRVRAKNGSTVVGVIVGISNGDGHPRAMRSGLDGTFRFDGVASGRWLVMEVEQEIRPGQLTSNTDPVERAIDWSCEVAVGGTTHHDLLLER